MNARPKGSQNRHGFDHIEDKPKGLRGRPKGSPRHPPNQYTDDKHRLICSCPNPAKNGATCLYCGKRIPGVPIEHEEDSPDRIPILELDEDEATGEGEW